MQCSGEKRDTRDRGAPNDLFPGLSQEREFQTEIVITSSLMTSVVKITKRKTTMTMMKGKERWEAGLTGVAQC